MRSFNLFTFNKYSFNQETKTLDLHYSLDDEINFKESFVFNFEFVEYNHQLLDKAFFSLFIMAGVSYYKSYMPRTIKINNNILDTESSAFFSRTYQSGLGEFFYNNKLDPKTKINFPIEGSGKVIESKKNNENKLVGIGGGKDSLLTLEILKAAEQEIATWSVGHRAQLTPLVEKMGTKHFFVDRILDQNIIKLNEQGAMNGHVPISAILAMTGTIVAILSGMSEVVVSNEKSADEPTLVYDGIDINHQFSKSSVFEKDYQQYLKTHEGDNTEYYSFLRPIGELFIAELFAGIGFEKYKHVFSSCNRAFTQRNNNMFWCGQCPKCAFTFLIFTPFVERMELESLWNGKNLLLDTGLNQTYKELLGIEGEKPLDCVGEIRESRLAMDMAKKIYPELSMYEYESDNDYNYREIGPDSMPPESRNILLKYISNLN
jgi:hypothetical protein